LGTHAATARVRSQFCLLLLNPRILLNLGGDEQMEGHRRFVKVPGHVACDEIGKMADSL
jgi:hypothetical protein